MSSFRFDSSPKHETPLLRIRRALLFVPLLSGTPVIGFLIISCTLPRHGLRMTTGIVPSFKQTFNLFILKDVDGWHPCLGLGFTNLFNFLRLTLVFQSCEFFQHEAQDKNLDFTLRIII